MNTRIVALEEQTATRSLHISITKRFIIATIQTTAWQFYASFSCLLRVSRFEVVDRESNKSFVFPVNVEHYYNVNMTCKKHVNNCQISVNKKQ